MRNQLLEVFMVLVCVSGVSSTAQSGSYDWDQTLRDSNRHRPDSGQWAYMEGADHQRYVPRDEAEVGLAKHNAPWQSSMVESKSQAVAEAEDEPGAERAGGAPNEHYKECAINEVGGSLVPGLPGSVATCECFKGEVRFGSADEDLWTIPTKMGEHNEVECSISGFQQRRVHLPTSEGAESTNQCQCIERLVRISTETMSLLQTREELSSFAEEEVDPPTGLYEGGGAAKMCLTVPVAAVAESSVSLAQMTMDERMAVTPMQRMLDLEMATDVELTECNDDDDAEIWTLLLSSGQLRHNKSGKCLGVYFDNGTPHIKANDCTLVESQVLTQRWMIPFYQMPDFTEGEGVIELGYGHQSQAGYCLSASGTETLEMVKCANGPTGFKVETATDPHGWSTCSQEGGNCACIGEIKLGNAESSTWTSAVPVPNELDTVADVKCDLEELRDIAIHDPVLIPNIDNPDLRQCQCRSVHALNEDEATASSKKAGLSTPLMAGIGGGVIVLLGGVFLATRKKSGDGLLDGEEEWEGEEEFEEEDYEEE